MRSAWIVIVSVGILTATGCRAKHTATTAIDSGSYTQRMAASALSDSVSIRLDILLDSLEILIADPPSNDSLKTTSTRRKSRVYGIKATLRSERRTDAASASTGTELTTSAETSLSASQTAVEPVGKGTIILALIIFSALLIFIHIKRNNK